MKITMIAVISANGKITHGLSGNISEWSSKEDQAHFANIREAHSLIVMGANTYKAIKPFLKLSKDKLRIVLTRDPKKYASQAVPGSLEFTNETPVQLINRLINYKKMLLVGGSQIFSEFLKENLVDQIYLTIEPVLFGRGIPLIADEDFERNLRLISTKKLNKKGTLLLRYKVNK